MSSKAGMPTCRAVARLASGLLAIGLLGMAMAATAMADAGANIRRSPGDSAAFTLPGSNGYSLYFKSEKGQLSIIASRQRPAQPTIAPSGKLVGPRLGGSSSESIYFLSGVSRNPSVIEADLGSVGSVSLTFQPSGARKVTTVDLGDKTEKCVGAAKIVRRLGNFVGSVSFHGENGYTEAEATSVPGTVGTSPFRNCTTAPSEHGHEAGPKQGAEKAVFEPTVLSAGGSAGLVAFRDEDSVQFRATGAETLDGGVIVLRQAAAVGGTGLFSIGPGGRRASLRPPAPFSGTGLYRDPPHGPPTWSGNLGVGFPGVWQPLTAAVLSKPVLRLGGARDR